VYRNKASIIGVEIHEEGKREEEENALVLLQLRRWLTPTAEQEGKDQPAGMVYKYKKKLRRNRKDARPVLQQVYHKVRKPIALQIHDFCLVRAQRRVFPRSSSAQHSLPRP